MMAMFFFIAHEKGFQFHAQPQTGAYSCLVCSSRAGMGQILFICYRMGVMGHIIYNVQKRPNYTQSC